MKVRRAGRLCGLLPAALAWAWAQIPLSAAACNVAPPAVAIVSPATGAIVGGEIAVYAEAADDTGVTGVRFMLDGGVLGTELTTPPYSITWNTEDVTDGTYTLSAQTLDATGRASYSAPVGITVDNGPGPRSALCIGEAGFSIAGECDGSDGDEAGIVIDACDLIP